MDPADLPSDLATRIETTLRRRPVRWRPVPGGYTPADRRMIDLDGGGAVFAKLATTDETVEELRLEHRVCTAVTGAFMPALLGWDDVGDRPLLLLEDLSAAGWPPPWTDDLLAATVDALREVAAIPAPDGLPALDAELDGFSAWETIAADPVPFLALAVCSAGWLDRALPALIAAERAADLGGDALVHGDVYGGNVCFADRGAVLVDRGNARRGNPRFDLATGLMSARAEGAAVPETILPDEPELAALLAGFAAYSATRPPRVPGTDLRALQLNDLRRAALPWAVAALSLPPPDR